MKSVQKKAYGKVNLLLSVGKKRSDGKHEVVTVMYRVGIFDTVTVTESLDGAIGLKCNDPWLPTDEGNIAYLAAKRYFEKANIKKGICIEIEKRIPVTAGMGGGSSDAAAVLLALNEIYGALTVDALHSIASDLGADVPFFLYETDAMIGRGVGTELTPCPSLDTELYGVFVTEGKKPSTGAAYSMLDLKKGASPQITDEANVVKALAENDVFLLAGAIENDFEMIAEHFSTVSDELYKLGSIRAFLCGSGPTVCGLFVTRENAEISSRRLSFNSFVARIGVK